MAEKKIEVKGYISREKWLNYAEGQLHELEIHYGRVHPFTLGYLRGIASVAHFPAADVAEITRCRDCVKRKTEDCSMYCECDCGAQHTWETDNDYCSWGVKAEE